MSGAIASSSVALLLLPSSSSSSSRRRRSRVSSARCSYGAASARLHWARRGFSRDGAAPCAAAASSPAAGGEEGPAKAAARRSKLKAAENEDATSAKAVASVAEQNGAAGGKSEVDPLAPVSRAELGSNARVSAAASGYWKDVVVGEQVGAKVDTGGDAEVASHLQVYSYAPFMVTSAAYGGSRPLYGGVYTVGRHGEGIYYPTWVAA